MTLRKKPEQVPQLHLDEIPVYESTSEEEVEEDVEQNTGT